MNMRSSRVMRGGWSLCAVVLVMLMAPMAMAQVRHHGAIPDGRGGITPLAIGDYQGCGLRNDGTAQCWGYDGSSRRATPKAGTYVDLSVGGEHSCGIHTDGTLDCWGGSFSITAARPPAGRFTALSSGGTFTCGLRAEAAWDPYDTNVQCWTSTGGATHTPWSGNFITVTAGQWHACGLLGTGEARCWKYSYGFDYGQAQPPAERFIAIAAGHAHTCGLRTDGGVSCWGDNAQGQSTPPQGQFLAISAGSAHTCGLRGDGTVECWGSNSQGQAAPPTGNFIALDVGGTHSCALRADGQMSCWGSEFSGIAMPSETAFGMGSVAAGSDHDCHIGTDGQLVCWGYNPYGWNPPAGRFTAVSSGERYSCARQDSGTNACWGWSTNPDGQLDIPSQPMRQLDVNVMHGCAVGIAGTPMCWGNNYNGQATPPPGLFRSAWAGLVHSCGTLGDGSGQCWGYNGDGENDVPTPAAGLGYVSVQAGERHSCGLASNGVIGCWGQATAVPAGYYRALAAGGYHDCGIRGDGTLQCWGSDWQDQLSTPVGVYAFIDGGGHGTCAIRGDGVRVCWGYAAPFQLDPYRLPATGLNQAYSAQLQLSPTTYAPALGAVHYRLVAGALPAGVSLAEDGVVSGTATESGLFPITVEGDGGNGFAVQKRYEFLVDTTPPVLTRYITGTPGSDDWYVSKVDVGWSISDDSDFITSGCYASVNSDTPGRTVTCTAQSAGGTSSDSVTVKVDVTAPNTTLTATPASHQSSAVFEFAGTDATSGLAGFECSVDGAAYNACTSPFSIGVSYGNHVFKVRGVDAAGLRDQTPATHSWLVDLSPPSITAMVIDPYGWHRWPVQLDWDVYEPHSTITSMVGCNSVTLASDTPAAGFTCTATSAGGTASKTVTLKYDATPPVITAAATTAASTAGWYKAAVTVAFACSDATSGVQSCPLAQTLDGEGTLSSTARTIYDVAGNSATSNVVTVKIDRVAPTLAPSVPDTLLVNAVAVASANGSDSLSGVAAESCIALSTTTVGSKSVSCSATDRADNTASASVGYRVVYGFAGFNAPAQNPSVLNVVKAGRSVPLRWRVVDAQGAPVSNLTTASVNAVTISCPTATENRISSYGGGNGQLQNLGNGYYQMDWMAATSLRGYCRRLELDLGDGEVHPALFKFN